ncbi:hypothetical protein E0I26_14835 [Flavobacterium rhamnosiphilum]|uniref:SWIM-type domain-containing protein n=1 Tax=Flavobacterium rhamnosiphilum TaxID=2541724 RepID=A0A4V2Z8W8_9FLAO|nr:SWIM zinc finger family protein [Flavobacterium rhamnosiphilum]TDE41990.1 hypothetical protein E0I26_14835 [Flavobacterium rhamnosiphilum]
MSILALNEESHNKWVARYAGNYGTYTIKIRLGENNQFENYSCSCPSDYSPCKHIGMILSKIGIKTASITKINSEDNEALIRKLFEGNSKEKFFDFLIEYSKYNPDFIQKIKLDFFTEEKIKNEINLNAIIRIGLESVSSDNDEDDYYYNHDGIELDILDEWKTKAESELEKNNPEAAYLIAKAMLEEYSEWLEYLDSDFMDYISEDYESYPFMILDLILENNNTFDLRVFTYLKEQFEDSKYLYADVFFFDFFGKLAKTEEQEAYYLDLLNNALKKIDSKYKEECILGNLIDFYVQNKQPEKGFELLMANLHIDSFRKNVVEKYMLEDNLSGAKQLIHDKLKTLESNHYKSDWYTYLLQIAELENDTADIRQYSHYFISNRFEKKHYLKYKATFAENQWKEGFLTLEKNYGGDNYFSSSLVELWIEECQWNKILPYFNTKSSIHNLENYSKYFQNQFPKETLELYKKQLNSYAFNNTGRNHYEYIATILQKMKQIEGGTEMANILVANYLIEYKNRPAMKEILNKLK